MDIQLKQSLEIHLTANFYPPFPNYVRDAIIQTFEAYWEGKIELNDEMAQKMYMRDVSAVYHYFEGFLRPEEFEDA